MDMKLPKIKLAQELSMREKLVFAVVLIVIFFLFSNMLFSSWTLSIRGLKAERKGIDQQAAVISKLIATTADQLSKSKSDTRSEFKQDERVRRMLSRRVTDSADEINSTADLFGSLGGGKVRVKKITTGERVDNPTYIMVPMSVEISGPFSSIQGYFRALEGIERPLLIRSFSVKLDEQTPGLLNATVNVELFIAKG